MQLFKVDEKNHILNIVTIYKNVSLTAQIFSSSPDCHRATFFIGSTNIGELAQTGDLVKFVEKRIKLIGVDILKNIVENTDLSKFEQEANEGYTYAQATIEKDGPNRPVVNIVRSLFHEPKFSFTPALSHHPHHMVIIPQNKGESDEELTKRAEDVIIELVKTMNYLNKKGCY